MPGRITPTSTSSVHKALHREIALAYTSHSTYFHAYVKEEFAGFVVFLKIPVIFPDER
jgi:hypothetical protein